LALKVKSQLEKKQETKRNTSYNEYYSKTWKGKERKDGRTLSKNLQGPPPNVNSSRVSNDKPNSSQDSRTSSIKCFKCF